MRKIIYKRFKGNLLDIETSEQWFSQMALEGLFVKKISGLLIHFEKGEPQSVQYKFEFYDNRLSQEKRDEYLACGWSFIGASGKMKLFMSEESNLTPLPTDFNQRKSALMALKANQTLALRFTLLSLLIIPVIFYLPKSSERVVESFVTGSSLSFLWILLLQIYQCYDLVKNRLLIQKIIDTSDALTVASHAKLLPNKPKSKASLYIKAFSFICIVTLGLLVIVAPILTLMKSEQSNLPLEETALPCVRLKTIETNADNMKRKSRPDSQQIDYDNYVDSSWSLLAPKIYHIREKVEISTEFWDNSSDIYSPSLATDYYQLSFEALSKPLFNELVRRSTLFNPLLMKNIDSNYFDEVSYRMRENGIDIIAYKDNEVFSLKYQGKASLDDLLSQFGSQSERAYMMETLNRLLQGN